MQIWEGTLYATIEEATQEGNDAKVALEESGMAVAEFEVIEYEDGLYQARFVYMSQEEHSRAYKPWLPWVIAGGVGLVALGGISLAIAYGGKRR